MKEVKINPNLVKVQNLNTGLVVVLSKKTAEKLQFNYPHTYKILDSQTPQTDKG